MNKSGTAPKYSPFSNCIYVIKDAFRNYPSIIFIAASLSIMAALNSILSTYLPSLVARGLENSWDIAKILIGIAVLVAGIGILDLLNSYFNGLYTARQSDCRQKFILYIDNKVMECDYQKLENSNMQVKIDKILNIIYGSDTSVGVNAIHYGMKDLFVAIISIISFITIIQRLHIMIVIIVIITSLIHMGFSQIINNYIRKNREESALSEKKINYMNGKLTTNEYAKDIRAFNCSSWLINKLESFIRERGYWFEKEQRKVTGINIARISLNLAYDICINGYAVFAVIKGWISISEFIFIIGLISQLSIQVNRFFGVWNTLSAGSKDVTLIREFLEDDNRSLKAINLMDKIGNEPVTIFCDNISFKYSEDSPYIIRNLTLKIKAGEKVALVGANGAGKSTLIKLICGLYKPTSGEIYINNYAIHDIESREVFKIFSVVFQEFVLFPFTVAGNVAMLPNAQIDYDRVSECLNNAGLTEDDVNLNSRMIKAAHEDGIELSGGQIQKLLIARALYKNAPAFLLDEPTAALDPLAEENLYNKYNELVRGKTSIFVSHRLASTKFCDRVLFMDGGDIKASDKHANLLHSCADYAKMFNAQSKYYDDKLSSRVGE